MFQNTGKRTHPNANKKLERQELIIEEISRWDEIEQSISALRKRVVIDCGHVSVRRDHQGFSFGGSGGPSASTLLTFEFGIALRRRLASEGREATLSLCLSDTSRLLGDSKERAELASAIAERRWSAILPSEYLCRLSRDEFAQTIVTLQTRNSNRFSGALKKFKTAASRSGSSEVFYRESGSLLLSSFDGDRLAVSTPFLTECTNEDAYYENTDWRSPGNFDREEDIIARPMTRLLRSGFINLYEKSSGILCPATYGGLLLNYDESSDHICIYSRSDDPHIGEKILRGVIAANAVSRDMSRTFLQIVFPEISRTPEISLLDSTRLKRSNMSWARFASELELRDVFSRMEPYVERKNSEGAPA
ncbi:MULTISPECIES: hypothetical protein [Burkholderia cepacia complex]|uniref:hypothetical protein n=1 Tax=Burkholderia cepacia complex TaxID=87882 RepID=UPI001906E39B|nr:MULTISPECIES: hypothetical protein [Burkholderia cepacia complex]MBK1822618.1 hypothetical protein [Burkholderia orbicola]MBR8398902.1 hypothetical protein [Burkholderia cenocepacia]